MDERKFENGFDGMNTNGYNTDESVPEVNPYFVSRSEEPEPAVTEAPSESVSFNETPEPAAEPDTFRREYSYNTNPGQYSFRENVKKEKKAMSVNAKIIIASVFSGLGGCVLAVCLIGCLLLTNTIGIRSGSKTSSGGGKVYVSDAPVASVNDGTGVTIPDIIDAVGPAVVGINCQTEYTDWFWGTSVQPTSGSGVIINEDGYVVTNRMLTR